MNRLLTNAPSCPKSSDDLQWQLLGKLIGESGSYVTPTTEGEDPAEIAPIEPSCSGFFRVVNPQFTAKRNREARTEAVKRLRLFNGSTKRPARSATAQCSDPSHRGVPARRRSTSWAARFQACRAPRGPMAHGRPSHATRSAYGQGPSKSTLTPFAAASQELP